MNKRILVLATILAIPSAVYCMQQPNMTDAQMQAAYDQAAKEQNRFINASKVGSLVGGLTGGAVGSRAAAALGTKTGLIKEEASLSNTGARVAGFGTGGYLGFKAGDIAGGQAAAAYYARKYGVSQNIATASLILAEPLSIPGVKQVFINASEQKSEQLRAYLINYFKMYFGENWNNDLKAMIEKSLSTINLHGNYDAEKIMSKNKKTENFADATWLIWALNSLYFRKRIALENRDFKTRVIATNMLLKTLNIIE